MEGEDLAGEFDFAFGKDADDAAVLEGAHGLARGGHVAAAAGDGDSLDLAVDPVEDGQVVIFLGHHPDDGARADGLDEERIEWAGVIADEDCGAGAGEAAGGEHIEPVIDARENAVAGVEDASDRDILGSGERGRRCGHGAEDYKGEPET